MSVAATSGVSPPLQSTSELYENSNPMDKNTFLQLLIAQLNYQDPLQPMENEQFVAQLAQFSSLEQMQNMNDNLEQSIESDFLLNQSLNNSIVTTLIGKDVVALTNEFHADGESSLELAFEAGQSMKDVKVTVYDANGAVVKEISPGNNSGDFTIVNFDVSDLPAGDYTFQVQGQSLADGSVVKPATYIKGMITGVSYEAGEARLVLNSTMLSLGDVARIVSRDSDAG
ncbi:MAG: hypothetical protein H6696_08325 [Deferribacteres bacterium]|nr:hypothetical protein [candidate division KSB1 bacterium]MCB9501928.1 hypothetical protein [Deferribacteres bacterium]